ncbi:hypothetical protein JCM10003_3540 [Bacteroides pyogenes JCM 10003]|nr:hypothetical protein [Phocaeicola vulgatus]GAE23723.1 hypothetical protein JCM10003_3540 [Bacteroides pyogenes JCM 10003]
MWPIGDAVMLHLMVSEWRLRRRGLRKRRTNERRTMLALAFPSEEKFGVANNPIT